MQTQSVQVSVVISEGSLFSLMICLNKDVTLKMEHLLENRWVRTQKY